MITALAACGGGGEDAAPTTTTTRPTTTTTEPPPILSMLTGEEVDDSVLDRPVVAIKYDNVDGKSTPQAGLAAADIVYEIQVEGVVTRFLALFQSEDAAPIGPVRSARGSEVGLLEELNQPLFTWHGANAILRAEVRGSAIVPRAIDDIPDLFYRDRSRPSPYNSFVDGSAEIRATAPAEAAGPAEAILRFRGEDDEVASPLAVPATAVAVSFPPFGSRATDTPVRYEWDGSKWLRFQHGHPHVDAAGNQIAVDNVIVRFTTAVDSGTRDTAGSRVPTAVVTGEGVAWVFSQGTVTVGTWRKDDNLHPARYLDAAGDDILLTPGTTWIAMPFGPGGSAYS